MRFQHAAALLLLALFGCAQANAQSAILQGGPWAPGHAPMYLDSGGSQPVVADSGPASGGSVGTGINELGLQVRGVGTPPFANAGTGPNGENFCDYDGPIDGANGYHYLCLSPNAQGGGLLSYGAAGGADALPLSILVNGTKFPITAGSGTVLGPSSSAVGDAACWDNTSGTVLNDCGPSLSVQTFGAKGDRIAFTNGVMIVSSNTFSSASHACNPALASAGGDVGKVVITHGTGAAGVPQQGTITGCSGASMQTSYSAATTVGSGMFWEMATDDTAAFVAAFAAVTHGGAHAGSTLYIPSGGYMLASQTTCLPLGAMNVTGSGWSSNDPPYTGGSLVELFNTSTAAFCGGVGGNIDGVTLSDFQIFYPLQDSRQASPLVYPPTFEAPVFVNVNFKDLRVMNSYDLAKVDSTGSGSGLGRVTMSGDLVYCINRCWTMLNGAADTLKIDSSSSFGQQAFGSQTGAFPMLPIYTELSGEFFHIDLTSGAYHTIDGMELDGPLVLGYRYGLRLVGTSMIDISRISDVTWDQVATILSVEGASKFVSNTITGGNGYSINVNVASQAACVFCFNSSAAGQSDFTMAGYSQLYAQGTVIIDAVSDLADLSASGNRFVNFGQSSTPGSYAALDLTASAKLTIAGTLFSCSSGTDGIDLAGFSNGSISGNTFRGCSDGIKANITSPGGPLMISGNESTSTTNASLAVFGSAAKTYDINNAWDRPPTPTFDSTWGTGLGNTGAHTDNFGGLVIGTGPSSPSVMTFSTAKPFPPNCVFQNITSGTALTVTAVSTTSVTVTGTKTAADVVTYSCRYN